MGRLALALILVVLLCLLILVPFLIFSLWEFPSSSRGLHEDLIHLETTEGGPCSIVAVQRFLDRYHDGAVSMCNALMEANWNYSLNDTDANKETVVKATIADAQWRRKIHRKATAFDGRCFHNETIRLQLQRAASQGINALDSATLLKYNNLSAKTMKLYNYRGICEYHKHSTYENLTCHNLPNISAAFVSVKNSTSLRHVWEILQRRGRPIRPLFLQRNQYLNEAARLNGFNDWGKFWQSKYDDEEILLKAEKLWSEILPLYQQLHAFIRRRLINKYGKGEVREDGPIPVHLLGNIVGNIIDLPYPNRPLADIKKVLISQGYTAKKIFQLAEKFFQSLGFKPVPEELWDKSILEKPGNPNTLCHATAWDFCTGKDFRILSCTKMNWYEFVNAHHEMGHIFYYIEYSHLPFDLRGSANPAFHEAIGDTISLSVMSLRHLRQLRFVNDTEDDYANELNLLFVMALLKVSFLPISLVIDLWRWKIFSNEIKTQEINSKWWEYRLHYEGVIPSKPRTEEDFDAGVIFHVALFKEYLRYFLGYIIQFQIHEGLCEASGHTGQLHTCDIQGSKEAGNRLRKALKLGASRPWPEVLSVLTGGKTDQMDSRPLLEYFQPLHDWLKKENQNEYIGWR